MSVLPFVAGEPGAGLAAAELLARIHARGAEWPHARARPGRPSYADLDWERNDWWDWSVVPKPHELVRAFDRVTAWIGAAPQLMVTPVHGDPAQQNVISPNGRIVGVLDWEWARLDWPALELALAASTFAEEDADSFVSAYAAAGGPGSPWVDYLLAELRELP